MCISCLFETNDTFWQKNEKNQANWSEATIAPNSAMTAEIPPLFRTFLLTLPYWPTIATTSYNFTQLLVDWFIYLHFNIPVVMGCHGMSWDVMGFQSFYATQNSLALCTTQRDDFAPSLRALCSAVVDQLCTTSQKTISIWTSEICRGKRDIW